MKIDLLAIMVHPDDAELCCAGTLLSHKAKGYSIGIVDLTRGELGSRGTAETRAEEAAEASQLLGLDCRENLGFEDGFFEISNQNKLRIVQAIRKYQPEIIITNAPSDRHPDHGRACQLVTEACFLSGLIKIETKENGVDQKAWRPKNVWHGIQDRYLAPDVVVDVSEFWDQKKEVIAAYKTQFYKGGAGGPKTPISGKDFWDFLDGRAREFGRNIGVEFAEGFVKSRIFGTDDLMKLR